MDQSVKEKNSDMVNCITENIDSQIWDKKAKHF